MCLTNMSIILTFKATFPLHLMLLWCLMCIWPTSAMLPRHASDWPSTSPLVPHLNSWRSLLSFYFFPKRKVSYIYIYRSSQDNHSTAGIHPGTGLYFARQDRLADVLHAFFSLSFSLFFFPSTWLRSKMPQKEQFCLPSWTMKHL